MAAVVVLVSPAAAQLPDLPVTRLERGQAAGEAQLPSLPVNRVADQTALDAPRTITLTFAQPVPVRDVLRLLVRATPFSVVARESATGTFSGELRDLTVRQALEAVLFSCSLDYSIRGTVIHVFPRRPETRLFEVNLLAVRRSSRHTTRGDDGRIELTSESETDVFAEIDRGVAALLSRAGRHHVDRRAGLVQVTDFADRLDQVGVYLESVQLRAARQVRLDARLIEVRLDGAARGVDWRALAATTSGDAAHATPGLAVGELDRLLQAAGEQGQVTVVSMAQFVAMNNEPALVRIGRGAGNPEGLAMTVIAQIGPDGIVQMNVATPLGSYGGPDAPLSGTDTMIRLSEGETVMISGLSPGLGEEGRTALIVLLTPTIVGPVARKAGQL